MTETTAGIVAMPSRGRSGPRRTSDRGQWRDLLTGRAVSPRDHLLPSSELFAELPAAVLVNE